MHISTRLSRSLSHSRRRRVPLPSRSRRRPGARHGAGCCALQLQVMLDRAGFRRAGIDGGWEPTRRRRSAVFKRMATKESPPVKATTKYASPRRMPQALHRAMPTDMMERAKLPPWLRLASEALSERFHSTPAFLQQLNPGVTFAADQETGAEVEPMVIPPPAATKEPAAKEAAGRRGDGRPKAKHAKPDVIVTVAKASSAVTLTDSNRPRRVLRR